jgi:hypothetical protein
VSEKWFPEFEEQDADDLEIERLQAQRRKMRDALEKERKAQLVIDLRAISDLEVEYGPANIATLETNHAPGLPAMIAVRVPNRAEMKRYQDTIKPTGDGKIGDFARAFRALGSVCIVYPKGGELETALYDQRPAVKLEAGHAALKLGESKAEAEGKG